MPDMTAVQLIVSRDMSVPRIKFVVQKDFLVQVSALMIAGQIQASNVLRRPRNVTLLQDSVVPEKK